MLDGRSCGLLLHLTSLPGQYGIGSLGRAATDFIDFLVESGQRYWQILPCGVVSPDFDCSPYMSLSAFAGNPLLIDLDLLVDDGLLDRKDLADAPDFSEYSVDFDQVISFNRKILETAFRRFSSTNPGADFDKFCNSMSWLDDFVLFPLGVIYRQIACLGDFEFFCKFGGFFSKLPTWNDRLLSPRIQSGWVRWRRSWRRRPLPPPSPRR